MRRRLAALTLLVSACAPVWPEDIGPKAAWDAAYDASAETRFIPMQLILPAPWDGAWHIDLPEITHDDIDGLTWAGPIYWTQPYTGRKLQVYSRARANGKDGNVAQLLAVRDDNTALGRVSDSRSGGLICDQDAKFPLGRWRQNESRTFTYTCWDVHGAGEGTYAATITIKNLDFDHEGHPHALRSAWSFLRKRDGRVVDHHTYVFVPGKGLVEHD